MIKKLKGYIGHGKQLGRTVGMPTMNLVTEEDFSELKEGVYSSVSLVRGERYIGITNIGLRPTVDAGEHRTIETYLLQFSGDVYGETVELELYQYIRDIKKFTSIEELKEQVEKDIMKIDISL